MPDFKRSIYTLAVSSGHEEPGDLPAPAMPSIVPSVGFVHRSMQETDRALGAAGGSADHPADYIYSRHGAPTQAAFESAIALLEEAEVSLSFSSGMAALHAALLATVVPGNVVLAAKQSYGATHTLLGWAGANLGLHVHFADALDAGTFRQAIEEQRPALVICETLTNPLARVVSLGSVIEAARKVGAKTLIDNTFATPFLITPLTMGADLVAHSATKFINGHGDVTGGVVSGSSELMDKVRTNRRLLGGVMSPFDAYLALRGLRTLPLRMRHACESAMQIARWLVDHPRVSRVFYPGLESDASHEAARAQFRQGAFGAMLAFEIANVDRSETFRLADCFQVIRPVTSLGDVNTLVSHPASSSHRGLSPKQRAAQHITEGTLRLSIGIEDSADIIADLDQALA